MRIAGVALAAAVAGQALAGAAIAGDNNGNFMVRVGGSYVISQDQLKSLSAGPIDLKALGFDAEVSERFIPSATLTYFFNRNLALELFCCFTRHEVDLKSPIAGLSGKVADTWMFPPALTLQYHFTGMGALKPYVGVGAQWIHFFNEGTGANPIGAASVNIKDAIGVTLQAGIDVSIGNGWYLNADVKKTWLDTTATWRNVAAVGGNDINAKVDIDPLIISAGLGYRFNLDDVFGRRSAAAPLK